MMQTGNGQWIWRPLTNPRELRVNRFMDESPRGFGLIQRERDFQQYQDLDSRVRSAAQLLERSRWAPGAKGGVELVEIPSGEDIHDNVVAYWVRRRLRKRQAAELFIPAVSLRRWPSGLRTEK